MFIRQSDLFKELDEQTMTEVSKIMVEESYKNGDLIYTEKDRAERFYILWEGRVKLSIGTGAEIDYTVSKRGEIFGWSSLVDRAKYTARAQCVEPTKVYGIDKDKIEKILSNHPDAGRRERTARYFCELVDFCADVGGRFMVVGSPKQRNVLPGVTMEQAWEWATGTFGEPVARAAARGVTICLEPLSPAETNFINTAAEAIRFVGQLGSPHFKIILDVKAMSSESKPVPQIIRESWPHFAYFHANDRNLKGPGFGDVDFRPIAASLKEVGYDGYVSVEVFQFEEGAEVIATRSLEYLERTFEV